jgi:hypothetical protein
MGDEVCLRTRDAAAGFKLAMDKAIVFEQSDLPATLEIFGKYVKMPPEVRSAGT